MRHLWAGLVAAIAILSTSCDESRQSSTPLAQPTAQQLADLVADTYRHAQQISYKAVLTQSRGDKEDWKLWCIVVDGPEHSCDLKVRDSKGPVFDLVIQREGDFLKVSEVNHRENQRDEYALPSSDYHEKLRGRIRCDKGIDPCRFGGQLTSWVGPDSRQASALQNFISEGTWIGTEEVSHKVCDVVQTHRVSGLDEKFYLDRQTHVVRRWTQTVKGVTRDRVFTEIKLANRAEN